MEENASHSDSSQSKKPKTKIVVTVFILLMLAALGYMGWKYQQAQNEVKRLSDPAVQQEAVRKANQETVNKVKKHILLPEGEEPSVADIADAETLASKQQFFKDAKNGDKLIIYSTNQKAIIYRPSEDIIVNVAPTVVNEKKEGDSATPDTNTQQ